MGGQQFLHSGIANHRTLLGHHQYRLGGVLAGQLGRRRKQAAAGIPGNCSHSGDGRKAGHQFPAQTRIVGGLTPLPLVRSPNRHHPFRRQREESGPSQRRLLNQPCFQTGHKTGIASRCHRSRRAQHVANEVVGLPAPKRIGIIRTHRQGQRKIFARQLAIGQGRNQFKVLCFRFHGGRDITGLPQIKRLLSTFTLIKHSPALAGLVFQQGFDPRRNRFTRPEDA